MPVPHSRHGGAAIGASRGMQAGYLLKVEPGLSVAVVDATADGYTSALTGPHYFVLSTESLREVIEPVA